jgi:hypothetical protein
VGDGYAPEDRRGLQLIDHLTDLGDDELTLHAVAGLALSVLKRMRSDVVAAG